MSMAMETLEKAPPRKTSKNKINQSQNEKYGSIDLKGGRKEGKKKGHVRLDKNEKPALFKCKMGLYTVEIKMRDG